MVMGLGPLVLPQAQAAMAKAFHFNLELLLAVVVVVVAHHLLNLEIDVVPVDLVILG
jgi:hypothetical protein